MIFSSYIKGSFVYEVLIVYEVIVFKGSLVYDVLIHQRIFFFMGSIAKGFLVYEVIVFKGSLVYDVLIHQRFFFYGVHCQRFPSIPDSYPQRVSKCIMYSTVPQYMRSLDIEGFLIYEILIYLRVPNI